MDNRLIARMYNPFENINHSKIYVYDAEDNKIDKKKDEGKKTPPII